MPKRVLRPRNLSFQPRPTYPYSPGTRGGDYVYTAGQVAWNDKGELVGIGDVRSQTRQVLGNIQSLGSSTIIVSKMSWATFGRQPMEVLQRKDIKKSIQNWRPDYWRV